MPNNYHIRRLRTLLLGGMMILAAWTAAAPAKRQPFKVTNSDGTTLTIMLCGDENFHFYATTDGVPVIRKENGDFRLAPEIADSITMKWNERRNRRNATRAKKAKSLLQSRALGKSSAYTGKRKGIAILVNFPNAQMHSTHGREMYNDFFNKKNYKGFEQAGSVSDYFRDQSYGNFELTFDVYGPIMAEHQYGYYGANDRNGDDQKVAELMAEACRKANAEHDIEWSEYDWDNDGEAELVYVIYAGYSEEEGAPSNTIWSHMWSLEEGLQNGDGDGVITFDGTRINIYAMSSELARSTGNTLKGIGTVCHEFSHCLGIPDFYNPSFDGGFGMNAWDVMDEGAYNGKERNGECPIGYTAHERWLAGWLTPIELKKPVTIKNMPALQDSAVAYIIHNEGNNNEYFMLENRQNRGWFQYVNKLTNCHGLMAYHADYDKYIWDYGFPNEDKDHQRMCIIPANGEYGTLRGASGNKYYSVSEEQLRGHLFPGLQQVTELTNTSHQDAGGTLFNKNTDGTFSMNKPVTDITESNGLISFQFMGGDDTSSIKDVGTKETEASFFTINGILATPPLKPGIYIKKQEGSTQKVLVK